MTRLKKIDIKPVKSSSDILKSVSKPVKIDDIKSVEIQDLIDAMIKFSIGKKSDDGTRRTMVGVSAPQFGIAKRIAIIDVIATGVPGDYELCEFINPEIIAMSEEVEDGREGCFSTGLICGIVERSKSVTIRGYNRNGEIVEGKYDGFVARIFQHEIDHMNGILFPDRITDDKKLHWVEPEEFGDYRINWATWKKLCPRSKWQTNN